MSIKSKNLQIDQRTVGKIGWAASLMAIAMYASYLDQIRLNLSGHQGSILLPIITVINCTLWVTYGASLEKRNWPIIVAT